MKKVQGKHTLVSYDPIKQGMVTPYVGVNFDINYHGFLLTYKLMEYLVLFEDSQHS